MMMMSRSARDAVDAIDEHTADAVVHHWAHGGVGEGGGQVGKAEWCGGEDAGRVVEGDGVEILFSGPGA